MTMTLLQPAKTDATERRAAPTATRVRFLSQNRPGKRMGMGHYERLLIQSLRGAVQDREWRFDITFDGRSGGTELSPQRLGSGIENADFLGFSTLRLANTPWALTRAAMRLCGARPSADLYHSLALSYPPPPGRPAVYTIHDLPPARFADEGSVPRWARRAAAEAEAIMTPSQFAKDELVELLGVPDERVHVIPYGCEHDVFHPGVAPATPEELAAKGIAGRFLLYAGGYTRRKNVKALLDAWSSLAGHYPDLSLALVGPAEQLAALQRQSSAQRVVVVGYLEHSVLRAFMKASQALVFPSIYEGFGLPPLEAMALGVPVVAVRAGALPEVVGAAGVLAGDGSPDALRAAIRSVLDDAGLAERLKAAGPQRAAGFCWARHAKRVLEVYRQAAGA